MKNIIKKLAACVCGLLAFCIASNTHAAGMAGTWKGLCDNQGDQADSYRRPACRFQERLSWAGKHLPLTGSTDNASDNGTLTLEGTGGNGILPRSCTADFTIPAPGQMSGTVTVRTCLGLRVFSGEASLQNPDVQVDFKLIIGHVQKPSNIYLFFSVQDGNGKPVTGLNRDDFEIYEDDMPISSLKAHQTIIPQSLGLYHGHGAAA